MLMVIFGAGASYDSSPDYPPPLVQAGQQSYTPPPGPTANPRERWRPPLASQLFLNPYGAFDDIVQKYNKLHPIFSRLGKPRTGSVEQELEALLREANADPERKRQLFAVRYYLRDLLTRVTEKWLEQTNYITNYAALLDQIRQPTKPNERVCLVTFNYDGLLDRALLSFDYQLRGPENQFNAHEAFKLFKPHGSIDWGRFVILPPHTRLTYQHIIERADTIEISNEFIRAGTVDTYPQDRSVFPAIAVPFQTKTEDTFEWPQAHRAYLNELLPSVTKILIIGWQAKEAHFLQMLRDAFRGRGRGVTHLFVVGAHEDNALETLNHFAADLGHLPGHNGVARKGFSQFVANREGEAFLGA